MIFSPFYKLLSNRTVFINKVTPFILIKILKTLRIIDCDNESGNINTDSLFDNYKKDRKSWYKITLINAKNIINLKEKDIYNKIIYERIL